MGLLREMCKSICIKDQAIHDFAFVGFFLDGIRRTAS
jgi:hypothetical protein